MKTLLLLASFVISLSAYSQTAPGIIPMTAYFLENDLVLDIQPVIPNDPLAEVWLEIWDPVAEAFARECQITQSKEPNTVITWIVGVRPRPADDQLWARAVEVSHPPSE